MSRIFCFGLWLGLLSSTSFAQLDELYGEGVHRYFANDLSGADQILSQVVDAGSQDPRVYYFRGLVYECLGADGVVDFESGARLEAEGKRVVDVGTALTRVQGRVRTKIETARRDARIVVNQQQLLQQQARQQPFEASGNSMPAAPPRDASPFPMQLIPADETGLAPLTPAAPAAPAAPTGDTTDPFSDDAAPAGDTVPATDPFSDDAAPAGDTAPATENDPFNSPATEAPAIDDPFSGNP